MIPLLLLAFSDFSSATPSVWQCPVVPFGPGGPFNPIIGETCPEDSFIHYYACCEDSPFECCFYLETWAIVVITILCVLLLCCCLFASAWAFMRYRKNSE